MIQQKRKRYQKILPLAIKDFVPMPFYFRTWSCTLGFMTDFHKNSYTRVKLVWKCIPTYTYEYSKDVEVERKILANFILFLDSLT